MPLLLGLRRARGRLASIVILAIASSVAGCGPAATGASGRPASTAPSMAPTSTASKPATAQPSDLPTPAPPATPTTTVIDGVTVTSLILGGDVYPLDIVEAFGSIWIANHHTDDVTRMDPATMEIVASVKAGAGPGWFAVTNDAIWVSNQNGSGMTRIDPATNLAVGQTGSDAPCREPIFALGSVWQPACDANVLMRIDPATNAVTRVPAEGRFSLVTIDGALYAAGEVGLARYDATLGRFVAIDGCCGTAGPIGEDGTSIWLSNDFVVSRFDPGQGMLPGDLALASARMALVAGDRAFVTLEGGTLVELDLETDEIIRRIKLGRTAVPLAATEDAVWVTAREEDTVWRVQR